MLSCARLPGRTRSKYSPLFVISPTRGGGRGEMFVREMARRSCRRVSTVWRRFGEFLCCILSNFAGLQVTTPSPIFHVHLPADYRTCDERSLLPSLPEFQSATSSKSFCNLLSSVPQPHLLIPCRARARTTAPFLLSLPLFSAVVAAARQSLRFFHLSAACDCERERSSYRQDHLPFCLGGHGAETEVGVRGRGRVGFPPRRGS